MGRLEPLGGFHQADIAFLDQIADRQTVSPEFPRHLEDVTGVGFDQFVKRSFILLFTPEACEFEFFLTFKNRGLHDATGVATVSLFDSL